MTVLTAITRSVDQCVLFNNSEVIKLRRRIQHTHASRLVPNGNSPQDWRVLAPESPKGSNN